MMNSEIRKKIIRTFAKNKAALAGLIISIIIVLLCLAAPFLPLQNPIEQSMSTRFLPPGGEHILGTDNFGRDVMSRIIWGGRISLLVGVLSVLIGMGLGVSIGLITGYKGGIFDSIIMRFIDVLMSFPGLILAILFSAAIGSGLLGIVFAIGLSVFPRFARFSRGAVLSVKGNDYVEAAKSIGLSDTRIMFRHILPNIMGDMIVIGTLWIGAIILTEASLSFIGLGIPPPYPSWGRMIREGIDYLDHASWVSVYSGLAILATVISFNMLGDGLRDIIDPKLRR
jgi:peptide/nickel transport system permease protein